MTANLFLSMTAFALATSISPGPVNIVALGSGVRYGFRAGQRHALGAAIGFTLLLLLIGLGLCEVLERWPYLTTLIRWGGAGYLLYMARGLAADSGEIDAGSAEKGPSFLHGALMQWLNPKAWLASVAGMGFYVADGDAGLVWWFSIIYCAVCYVSIACWVYAGAFLRRFLGEARRIRLFNRFMAALLAASALYLLAA